MFVSWRILNKIHVFSFRGEKRSDVHTKDKRIRKEISSRNKAFPAKASLSEKLITIEKLHQPNTSVVCLSNTIKATISPNKYIVYTIVTPLLVVSQPTAFVVTKLNNLSVTQVGTHSKTLCNLAAIECAIIVDRASRDVPIHFQINPVHVCPFSWRRSAGTVFFFFFFFFFFA